MALKPAAKITIIYLLFGITWIVLSDRLIYLFFGTDAKTVADMQSYKGIFYVLFTGYFLYTLMRSFYRKRELKLQHLEQQEAQLKVLRSMTKTGNWDFDPVNKKLAWSAETVQIFELPESEPERNPHFIVDFIKYPEDRERVIRLWDEGLQGKPYDIELEIITAKGNEKWIRLVGTPVMQNGKCVKLFGMYQDISHSRIAAQKISQLSRLNNFITGVNKAIVRTQSETQLLNQVCEIATSYGQFSRAWLGKLNHDTQVLESIACCNVSGNAHSKQHAFDLDAQEAETLTQCLLNPGRLPLVMNRIDEEMKHASVRGKLLAHGFRSLIVLPLITFGRQYAILVLYSHIPDFFDAIEKELLMGAADDIAHALENIEQEQLQTITKQQLQQSEERYRMIVETASEGMILLDEKFCILFANANLCRMLGHNEAELRGRQIATLMPAEDGCRLQQELSNSDAVTCSTNRDYHFTTKNGGNVWAQVSVTPIRNETGNGALVMITDISSRKEAESQVREALERYDLLTRATHDTIWDWDIAADHILYNKGIEEVFGYVAPRLQHHFQWKQDRIPKAQARLVRRSFEDAFAQRKESIQNHYRFMCAEGHYKDVFDRAFIQYNEAGKPHRVIGTMQDITLETELESRIEKAVVSVQEQERRQIGMELHDNVNQLLAASLLYVGLIQEALSKNNDPSHMFVSTEKYLKDAIDEVRRLSHELAPVSFKDVPISTVMNNLLDVIKAENLFAVDMEIDPAIAESLPVDIKINLYRIAQEQMSNIIKHAQAKAVHIVLRQEDGMIRLSITDNGKGFDTQRQSNGIGLENIRRRAKLFGGNFHLQTAPGEGCELTVEIPVNVS